MREAERSEGTYYTFSGVPMIITINDFPRGPVRDWILSWDRWLSETMGLSSELAGKIAILIYAAAVNNISFRFTSGFRSPEKQKRLLDRWNRGDRVGLKAKPAVNSRHSRVDWLGKPAAQAVDVVFGRPTTVGRWAPLVGLKWGGTFRSPDTVHFFT